MPFSFAAAMLFTDERRHKVKAAVFLIQQYVLIRAIQ
jgi:hypothetical protein